MGRKTSSQREVAWSASHKAFIGFVTFPNGTKKRAKSVDKQKAQERLDELLALREREESPEKRDKGVTFDDVITAWLKAGCPKPSGAPQPGKARAKHATVKDQSTITTAERCLRTHVSPRRDLDTPERAARRKREPNPRAIGHLWVDRTQGKRVSEIFDHMASEDLSTAYIDKTWDHLNMALEWGKTQKRMNRTNPAMEFLLPARRPARVTRNFSLDEAELVFGAIPLALRPVMWLTALMLGLRPGEVIGLRWRYIDLDSEKPSIAVVESAHEVDHKYVGQTKVKTGRESRLELHPLLAELLRKHRDEMIALNTFDDGGAKFESCGFVFPTKNGTPLSQSNFRREFQKLLAFAGLEESDPELGRFVPYSLRHSFASIADHVLDENKRREIGRVMGHSRKSEGGVHGRITAGYIHNVHSTIDTCIAVWDAFLERENERLAEAGEILQEWSKRLAAS